MAYEPEYDAVHARYYDGTYAALRGPDADFYLHLARETGGPVLELGCGTGRVLLPIARAGFEIAALYGGFDRRPYDQTSNDAVIVARPAG